MILPTGHHQRNSHVLTMNWKCKRFLQGSTPTFLRRSERESGADYPKRFYVMTHRNGISKRGLRFDSFSDFWGNFALCVQCDTLWQKTIFRLKITLCCRISNWWYKWVKNLTNFKPISKRKVRNKTFLNLDLESRKLKPIFFNFYGNRLRNSEGKPHRRPAK